MVRSRKMMVLFLGCFLLGAQPAPPDPVLKARAERAQAQGIGEGDLPPVPRGIVEPPPLPPPETHLKDTRGVKAAKIRRASRTAKGGKSAKSAKSAKSPKSAKTKKLPAKGGRKSSKRVKG
ncbi:hypothetical protein [Mesoterricola silvestris]|uniref:Uncharacterized protein n=1 Tax=Mesoterricola silvestris TaxID=2927979 RepID=A0AA48GKL4_9BACT|nr:hypothetical protein [Mesoterricola silvestris]BDU71489.1 hypothetical protein METEAL_06630 [Mesoterricola silvestris]